MTNIVQTEVMFFFVFQTLTYGIHLHKADINSYLPVSQLPYCITLTVTAVWQSKLIGKYELISASCEHAD